MVTSKAQIFNIALNILGVSVPIEKADSTDNRYILLNNYYELARDYVLKDFDWNFASTFKDLSLIDKDNILSNVSNYEFCYSYPNNCICARDLFIKGSYILNKFCVHCLESNEKVIFTNAPEAVLRFTRRISNENYYSPEFSMALAYYLASLTSNVVVGSIQKGELAYQKYTQLIRHAKVLNAQEGADNIYSDNTYLDTRG